MVGQSVDNCSSRRFEIEVIRERVCTRWPSLSCLLVSLPILLATGCAAVTSPVTNGVPVHMLPSELLADSKEKLHPIPPTWLKAPKKEYYTLDTGDILGVYIKDVLPISEMILPVNFPDSSSLPPSTGVPIPVRQNGTISLPLIGSVDVRGLTVEEAEEKIVDAYLGTEMLNEESKNQILVSLARPRQIRVLVVRDDSPGTQVRQEDPGFRLFGSAELGNRRGQGFGSVLEMPSNEADLISALTRTGGFPGPNGTNEVFIYRGWSGFGEIDMPADWNASRPEKSDDRPDGLQTIRIPLRIDASTTERPFSPEDVRLHSDDIVFVPARTTDVYYTGGLLPAREVPLPRDYDVPALEAVLRVGGSVISGGRFTNNFTGGILTQGLGNPSPSLLTVIRRMPGGSQVVIRVDLNKALTDPRENLLIKEGDVLLLQETPSEAVARYFSNVFRLNGASEVFQSGSAAASAAIAVP